MFALKLGGAMSKRTITLNGLRFVNGIALLPSMTFENVMSTYGGLINYFKTCYQAELVQGGADYDQFTETTPTSESIRDRSVGQESTETQAIYDSADVGVEGWDSGGISSGDGYENSGIPYSSDWTARQRRIAAALEQLDDDNDDHWTQLGLPRVDAIEIIMGDSSVTRQEINVVAPDFSRPNMESTL